MFLFERKKQKIIQYLLEYKCINLQEIFNIDNLTSKNTSNFMNIFKTFFQYGNFVALIYILKRGIDPTLFLEAASSCGLAPAVRFIINHILTNKTENENDNSIEILNEIKKIKNPIHYACLSGNEETVKILLSSNLFNITDKLNKGTVFKIIFKFITF